MKKVAFCFRGAVSKNETRNVAPFSTENSLYKEGYTYVDFVKCRNSIFKFIVSTNPNYEFDFFCHCWNVDLESDLKKLYDPKLILVEDNNHYAKEIRDNCNAPEDFGGISQSLSMRKSILLKEEYEKKHNFSYDIVILYRYDVLLWKELYLDTYPFTKDTIFVNKCFNGNGDFHFIMENHNSYVFKGLFDSIKLGNQHKCHFWIKNFIVNFCKKQIKEDNILCGKHQEVIRKIKKCSINKGYLSQKEYDDI